jgi:peptidoglycan/LPS O-acetylase OafA/YrhL
VVFSRPEIPLAHGGRAQVTAAQVAGNPRRLGRRPVLDGLRGVAIVLVMLMHQSLLPHGYIGVDLFFALSGFLITSLLLEEWGRTGAISLRRFYARRARRLLPCLLLLVGAFVVIDVLFHPFVGLPAGVRALTTLAFINDWVAGLGGQGLGALNPTWSLALEEQFYLVWPLALVVLLRRGAQPLVVLGWLIGAIVLLVAAVPAVEHLLPAYSLYYSPLDRAAELLVGCAGAIVWRERLLSRFVASPLVAVAAVAALLELLRVDNGSPLHIYAAAIGCSIVLILWVLEHEDTWLARAIGCAPLRYIGRISYGLYLFNLLVRNLVLDGLPGHTALFYAPVSLAITFAIAAASWHLIESPILSGGTRVRPALRALDRRPRLQPAR